MKYENRFPFTWQVGHHKEWRREEKEKPYVQREGCKEIGWSKTNLERDIDKQTRGPQVQMQALPIRQHLCPLIIEGHVLTHLLAMPYFVSHKDEDIGSKLGLFGPIICCCVTQAYTRAPSDQCGHLQAYEAPYWEWKRRSHKFSTQ